MDWIVLCYCIHSFNFKPLRMFVCLSIMIVSIIIIFSWMYLYSFVNENNGVLNLQGCNNNYLLLNYTFES